MVNNKTSKCTECGRDLTKDWIALNKKLLDRDAREFECIYCMADYVGCEVSDLEFKIEQFKEEGCTLFQ